MDMDKKIYIYANDTEMSKIIEKTLRGRLVKSGLRAYDQYDEDTQLIMCIGGDGTLLVGQDRAAGHQPLRDGVLHRLCHR